MKDAHIRVLVQRNSGARWCTVQRGSREKALLGSHFHRMGISDSLMSPGRELVYSKPNLQNKVSSFTKAHGGELLLVIVCKK